METRPLMEKIKKLSQEKSQLVIAIDGRGGSGKSTLAEKIAERFPNTEIIHLDAYELYAGEKSFKRVVNEVLKPICVNSVQKRIIIIEGVFAFSASLLPFYDYKIWVECPEKTGFERGLQRDLKKDGVDYSDKWFNYWLPKERTYIENERPQEKADYTITNISTGNKVDILA